MTKPKIVEPITAPARLSVMNVNKTIRAKVTLDLRSFSLIGLVLEMGVEPENTGDVRLDK